MSSYLSSVFSVPPLERGGLAQVISLRGGSKTQLALSHLGSLFKTHVEDPPLSLWVSDEGVVYPALLEQYWKIPLCRFLIAKVNASLEVWRVGCEAIQTGLFRYIFLRPSRACPSTFLRRLQLGAERSHTQVFLLYQTKLSHWTIKVCLRAHLRSSAASRASEIFACEDAQVRHRRRAFRHVEEPSAEDEAGGNCSRAGDTGLLRCALKAQGDGRETNSLFSKPYYSTDLLR